MLRRNFRVRWSCRSRGYMLNGECLFASDTSHRRLPATPIYSSSHSPYLRCTIVTRAVCAHMIHRSLLSLSLVNVNPSTPSFSPSTQPHEPRRPLRHSSFSSAAYSPALAPHYPLTYHLCAFAPTSPKILPATAPASSPSSSINAIVSRRPASPPPPVPSTDRTVAVPDPRWIVTRTRNLQPVPRCATRCLPVLKYPVLSPITFTLPPYPTTCNLTRCLVKVIMFITTIR